MDALDAIGVLEVLHAVRVAALIGAQGQRLAGGGDARSAAVAAGDGGKPALVNEVATSVLLNMVEFAVLLLKEDGASAFWPLATSVCELVLLVALLAVSQADSLDEAVLSCASLPATAAIVGAAVLFLSGEDDGTAAALVAGLVLSLVAGLLPQAAAPGELRLMQGALAVWAAVVGAAVWLLGGEPAAHEGALIDGSALLCVVGLGSAAAVVSAAAAPEEHALAQFSLASAAMMVGASLFLLSGAAAPDAAELASWALVAAASLVFVSAKAGEVRPALSSLAAFLATVAWSVRIVAAEGEVATFVDGSLWFVVCWILPGVALVVNIAHASSDRREAFLVSGSLLATAAILWWALYLLDPSQVPAIASRSAYSTQTPPDRACAARAAATNVHAPVERSIHAVAEPLVEQAAEPEVRPVGEPIVAAVKEGAFAETDAGEPVPSTSEEKQALGGDGDDTYNATPLTDDGNSMQDDSPRVELPAVEEDLPEGTEPLQEVDHGSATAGASEESIAANNDIEAKHDARKDRIVSTNARVAEVFDIDPSMVADVVKPDSLASASPERLRPERNWTTACEQEGPEPFDVFACPGCWALLYSLPLIGKAVEFKAETGFAGAAAFGVATGAAFFLAISMFECSFRYLAPEDAGSSVCVRPDLLIYAMVAMMACVMSVPAVTGPSPACRGRKKASSSVWEMGSGLVLAMVVGLCVTANMTGCALHHVAPKEMRAAACGPFILFSRPTGAVTGLNKSEQRTAVPAAVSHEHLQQDDALRAKDAARAAEIEAEMQRRAEEAARAEAAAAEAEEFAEQIAVQAATAAREAAAAAAEARALASARDSSAADLNNESAGKQANEVADADEQQLAAARKAVEVEIRRKAAELRGEKVQDASMPPGHEDRGADKTNTRIEDERAPAGSRLIAFLDSIIIIGVSVAVFRTFVYVCERGSIPTPWVIQWSGDLYRGEVLEVTKKFKLLFTEVEEARSLPHGYGVYTFSCGTEYDGGWKEGRMCGVHGKLTFAEGHVYDGEWEAGLFSGHGTFTWASGAVFMGEFKDGLPNGQGIKTWTDGDSYSGQWKDGCKHGFGKYTWGDGKSYSGGWQQDKMHGHGTYIFENGDSFTGAWEHDAQAGLGTYRWADGHSELRIFRDEDPSSPDSSVVPGECPKTGKKFVASMSNFKCASEYRSPTKSPRRYASSVSPRKDLGSSTLSNGSGVASTNGFGSHT